MDDWEVKWQLLVADSWDDEELKNRLLSDPMAVCKERGIVPPEGVKIVVVANSDDTVNLVLPEPPSEFELSEEELEDVAGGLWGGCQPAPCRRCVPQRCRPQRCRCRPPQGRCYRCHPAACH